MGEEENEIGGGYVAMVHGLASTHSSDSNSRFVCYEHFRKHCRPFRFCNIAGLPWQQGVRH